MNQYYVYILTNWSRMLYTGVTNDLNRRLYERKQKLIPGYTSRYNIKILVYYEVTSDTRAAIAREKQIKAWTRAKRVALIESVNPAWRDLSADWHLDQDSSRSLPRAGQDPSRSLPRAD